MDNNNKLARKAVSLTLLILIVELLIYFKDTLTMGFLFIEIWFIPLIAITLAVAVGWFFYAQTKKNNQTKNQFIEIATHKFRTPLAVIGWSADSLETAIDITQRRDEVKKIRNSLEKLREIIDILVGVTEADNDVFYHFEITNLRRVIERSLSGKIKKDFENKGIKLLLNLPKDMPQVYADTKRMEFVFKSILENAITYTGRGGEVEISAIENKDSFLVKIQDSGIGISKKELPFVFTNFYRSRDAKLSDTEGMGLGLFVSKKIIEKHGGEIWVESEGKDMGSTFYIRLKVDKYKQVS